tara:strand:- start:947 stop:1165 length:219 start_codon:yes stop_codon:yes gene_type:complete
MKNKENKMTNYKLSNQAVGALMMALQKGLMEQCDITELLKGFDLSNTADGLVVENPPMISVPESELEEDTVA